MTPCEERGLKEGQWVWATKDATHTLDEGWVQLVIDDGSSAPGFGPSSKYKSPCCGLERIDFTQGIHNEKPHWTPKEYGGEGPPADPRDPEFWRDAPEGAEEVGRDSLGNWIYYRNITRYSYEYHPSITGKWSKGADGNPVVPKERRFSRPTTWTGDGLPPVGTVCECGQEIFDDEPELVWRPGDRLEVLAHKKSTSGVPLAVTWNQRTFTAMALVADALRPIRTERERVIEDALSVIEQEYDPQGASAREYVENAVAQLYDKGRLRSPKEPDNE